MTDFPHKCIFEGCSDEAIVGDDEHGWLCRAHIAVEMAIVKEAHFESMSRHNELRAYMKAKGEISDPPDELSSRRERKDD